MNIPKKPPVGEESSTTQIRLARTRTMTAAATLALVGAFIFTGTPAAIAAPASTNNYTSYAADPHAPKPSSPSFGELPRQCMEWPDCGPWPHW